MKKLYYVFIAVLLGASIIYPRQLIDKKQHQGLRRPDEVMVAWANRVKQGFNLRVWLSDQMTLGLEAWGFSSPDGIGCEYPAGSAVEHVHGAGPLIGAKIDGRIFVSEGYNGWDARKEIVPEYSHRWRERIWRTAIGDPYSNFGYYFNNHIIVNRKGVDDDGDGLIDEDDLNGMDDDGDWNLLTDDVGSDGLADPDEMSCDGQPYDPITNPDPAGDNYDPSSTDKCHPNPDSSLPYKNNPDVYTEKNGIPDHGEPHVDEDYAALSHNDLYCGATDTVKSNIVQGHLPMGVKVIQKSYAWKKTTGADAIILFNYNFINLGSKPWEDAYVSFFTDADVGSVNVQRYYENNYVGYDSSLKIAYVNNPTDENSTPIGVVLLGASKPLDSLDFIFKWSDFTTPDHIDPGTNDSMIYTWITTHPFGNTLIDTSSLSDVRLYMTLGKFQMQQNDTVSVYYALVSGMNINEMLNNARKAKLIYDHDGFVMPLVHIADSGKGNAIKIYWDDLERSPFGRVTSYRVYHGTSSGIYTDSITTNELSVTFKGLPGLQTHYFAVAAFDEKGNRSPNSDEVTNYPSVPMDLILTPLQTSILLEWSQNNDPDIYGYNLYRKSSIETSFVKINYEVIRDTSYLDTNVWGDKSYSYALTAVDSDGHESGFSHIRTGHLIPPAIPKNFIVIKKPNYYYLNWSPNTEDDLKGYNIYRKSLLSYDTIKLNTSVWEKNYYIDSIPGGGNYLYRIEAVDITDAVSAYSNYLGGYSVSGSSGILAVHFGPLRDSSFYQNLLSNYSFTFLNVSPQYTCYSVFNYYSTLLIFYDDPYPNPVEVLDCYPLELKRYVYGDGKLLIMGRMFTNLGYPNFYQYLADIFGINQVVEIGDNENFSGAFGRFGFPDVIVDTLKIQSPSKRLSLIERFKNINPERVVYSYRSDPFDSTMEGKPIGIQAVDTSLKAYYFSFPIYYLDDRDAKALIQKVLTDFGEVMGVQKVDETIPQQFKLYDPYPNPFNPSTRISFDLPFRSKVNLVVYNILGQEVAKLLDEEKDAGKYEVIWDASKLSSGVYFYRIEANSIGYGKLAQFIETRKAILIK